MLDDEQKLMGEAERYVKDHKQELIKRFADPNIYRSDEHPISLFMAGSPGAGKTEFSKQLIEGAEGRLPVRIDADDIRSLFPNYTGDNSHIFQPACTTGVNILFQHVLDLNLNVLLDATFAYARAMENIERSLKRGRRVVIYYLFQDPLVAWGFTKARQQQEGRTVPRDVFIRAFLRARENVLLAKKQFGESVELNLTIKDFEKGFERTLLDVADVDHFLPRIYSEEELEKIIV